VETFPTPEAAARVGTPPEYVRVIGVVVRGDTAVGAQVMNADGYPDSYETETATCHREGDGWVCGPSGNGDVGAIPTAPGRATVVVWQEAPMGAKAGRFVLGAEQQVVEVAHGFALAVFDDVATSSDGFSFLWPSVAEWLS
jgi:hypothetical protein